MSMSNEGIRFALQSKLFDLMVPHSADDEHLRDWIIDLDDTELVEMFATEKFAAGHKAGEEYVKRMAYVPCQEKKRRGTR